VYLKNRVKEVLREMVPAHLRFIRLGKLFVAHGGPEVHILQSLVEYGSTVIDIGANVGQYSYALCQYAGPKGLVIAVEPLPETAELLRSAARRLGLPVVVFECALSSRDGEAELLVPIIAGEKRHALASLEQHSAAGLRRRVSVRRLDDLCREVRGRISFIKIDVEGHELEVLRGGIDTLQQHRPSLLVEIEQRHSPVPIDETFAFMTSLGYLGQFLDGAGRCQPLACFDVTEHQTRHLDDIGNPAYINNFIFRMPSA
jgi:FkbM family methyltransferase